MSKPFDELSDEDLVDELSGDLLNEPKKEDYAPSLAEMIADLPPENDPENAMHWDERLSLDQRLFLSSYAACGTVRRAAASAKVRPRLHYTWMRNEIYEAEFKLAEELAVDTLEDVAIERARLRSDTLLVFILKGKLPNKYGDVIKIQRQLGKLSDDELDEIIKSGSAFDGAAAISDGGESSS